MTLDPRPLAEAEQKRTAGEWSVCDSFDTDGDLVGLLLKDGRGEEVVSICYVDPDTSLDDANAAFIAATTHPETGVAAALREIERLRAENKRLVPKTTAEKWALSARLSNEARAEENAARRAEPTLRGWLQHFDGSVLTMSMIMSRAKERPETHLAISDAVDRLVKDGVWTVRLSSDDGDIGDVEEDPNDGTYWRYGIQIPSDEVTRHYNTKPEPK